MSVLPENDQSAQTGAGANGSGRNGHGYRGGKASPRDRGRFGNRHLPEEYR